jgi:hypothetical protein
MTPFYVGKGTGGRAYHMSARNKKHKNIRNKHGVRVEIVKYFEDEQDAYDFEILLINLYKTFKYAEACFQEGGQKGFTPWNKGKTGIYTKDTLNKISNSLKGKKLPDYQKSAIIKACTTDEHREKLRQIAINQFSTTESRRDMAISKGGKPFKVSKNGKFVGEWVNQAECAKDLNLFQSAINKCLKGVYKSSKGFKFEYVQAIF